MSVPYRISISGRGFQIEVYGASRSCDESLACVLAHALRSAIPAANVSASQLAAELAIRTRVYDPGEHHVIAQFYDAAMAVRKRFAQLDEEWRTMAGEPLRENCCE